MKIQMQEVINPVEWRKVMRREIAVRKLTQAELAKTLGRSERVVNTWFTGMVEPPLEARIGILWIIRRDTNAMPYTQERPNP